MQRYVYVILVPKQNKNIVQRTETQQQTLSSKNICSGNILSLTVVLINQTPIINHMETSYIIGWANQLHGFYMTGKLVVNMLQTKFTFKSTYLHKHFWSLS